MMLACAVPLRNLLPGLHYTLRLKLRGGPLDSRVSLDVTLCLTAAHKRALRAFKQAVAASARAADTLLVAPTVGTPAARPPARAHAHPGSTLFAVWRLEPHQGGGGGGGRLGSAPPSTAGSAAGAPHGTAGSAARTPAPTAASSAPEAGGGGPSPLEAGALLCTVEADSEDACASAIAGMSEAYTSAAAAGVQVRSWVWVGVTVGSICVTELTRTHIPTHTHAQGFAGMAAGGVLDVVPLCPSGASLWPADHAAALTCSPTPDSDLVMELHCVDGHEAVSSTATGRAWGDGYGHARNGTLMGARPHTQHLTPHTCPHAPP